MNRIPLLTALVMLLLAACSPAQVKAPPDGTYTRDEVNASGTSKLIFVLNKGQFVMNGPGGEPLWEGTYQVVGNKVVFKSLTDTPRGQAFCGSKDDFSYSWTYDSAKQQLKFAQDSDPCTTRISGTVGVWTFQPG